MRKTALVFAISTVLACGTSDDPEVNNGTNNTTNNTTNNSTNNSTNNTNNSTNNSTNNATNNSTNNATNNSTNNMTGGGWIEVSTACAGSKTNALWFDDANVGYAGCGEAADGFGLFKTTDGGATWSEVRNFEALRINDIRRVDGTLYLAGIRNPGGGSAFKVIDTNGTLSFEVMFTPSNNAFSSTPQGENIAVASDGAILVDSLTGRSATLVTADGTVIETSTLHEDAIADPDTTSSFQVRRLQMVNDRFAGVGSTINEPAQFMAPSTLANATFHMKPVELQPSNEDGELLDLHVWGPQKMITAGWNQTTNAARSPLIFRIDGADPTDAGNWTRVDVFAQGIEYDGGVYALATRGDEVIAVGTKFPTSSGGFVIHSTDAGQTWTDITPGPDKPGEISNAWIFEDGSVYVAGGGLEAYKMSGN